MDFDQAILFTMKYEVSPLFQLSDEVRAGLIDTPKQRMAVGFSDDPFDNGGVTKFGVAQNSHPNVDVKKMTWEQAKEIYKKDYWAAGKCDQLPELIAVLHFDLCVNSGVRQANMILQKALNTKADGVIGPITLAAVQAADQKELCKKLLDGRRDFVKQIVFMKPAQGRFLKGWLARIDSLEKYVEGV